MIKLNLDFLAGAIVGFGAGVVSREIAPDAAGVLRPLAKSTIKAGLASYDKAVEGMARLKETIEDITAEARAEHAEKASSAPAPATEPESERPLDEAPAALEEAVG